jgi:hypothetical protein
MFLQQVLALPGRSDAGLAAITPCRLQLYSVSKLSYSAVPVSCHWKLFKECGGGGGGCGRYSPGQCMTQQTPAVHKHLSLTLERLPAPDVAAVYSGLVLFSDSSCHTAAAACTPRPFLALRLSPLPRPAIRELGRSKLSGHYRTYKCM